jgi:hypothetical protein
MRSDINLYITSHTRENLESAWSRSTMQKPSFENPNIGESINEYLRDTLGREITICCSDDPWWWVEGDVKCQIFPTLSSQLPCKLSATANPDTHLLKVIRKAWYHAQRVDVEEAAKAERWNEVEDASPSSCEAIVLLDGKIQPSYRESRRYHVVRAITGLFYLLEPVRHQDWRGTSPYLHFIASVVRRLEPLNAEVGKALHVRDDTDTFWNISLQRYQAFVLEICALEDVVLARPS